MEHGQEVFVDLSNVAKDPLLGFSSEHASLARWDRLRSVWLRERDPRARFHLIADDSLARALSMSDRSRLSRFTDSGEAVVVPDADVAVLTRAIAHDGIALSNDRYVDHRKLDGLERARLVGWVTRGTNVRLIDRALDRMLTVVVSARAEKQALKQLGVEEGAPALDFRWFCRDAACGQDLIALPNVVNASEMCPWCGGFLERGSRWNLPVWVKVARRDEELLRFVLEDGQRSILGGGQEGDLVIVLISGADGERTGDDEWQLELANQSGHLQVRALASSSGVSLRRPVQGNPGRFYPPMPVSTKNLSTVAPGTKIVLAGHDLTVQVAGSRGTTQPWK